MSTTPWTSIYPDGPASAAAGGIIGAPGAGGNAAYPGMPVGAVPIHRTLRIAAAGTYPIWAPPPDRRFIVANAFISTDTAMRVALVEEVDVAGAEIVDGYFAASGGASPNLVPVPYPADVAGSVVRVVTGAAGNVRIRVGGWEVPA
jgi:hypothetical protein